MNRRGFLSLFGAGALFVAVPGCALIPPIPSRPDPDMESALGWLAYRDGAYHMFLPRAEMGQGIKIALRQIVCAELGIPLADLGVTLQDTSRGAPARATVGSESVKDFALPLAQAAAALRDAVAEKRPPGEIVAEPRPVSELRAFRPDTLVGRSEIDEDQIALAQGAPLFAADVQLPDMLHGRVLRAPASPEFSATLLSHDPEAARDVPGFVALYLDLPVTVGPGAGVGIVAKSADALDRIEAALSVTWATERAEIATIAEDLDVDRHFDFPKASGSVDPTRGGEIDLRIDIDAAPHNPMEPRCAVARDAEGLLEVWTGSQDVYYVRDVIARQGDRDPDTIQVRATRIGGGFGGRTLCTVEWDAAALASRVGRPVKVQWTRDEEYRLGFHRPPVSYRIRARMEDGALTSWSQRYVSSHILFTSAVLPAWLQGIISTVAGDEGVSRGATPLYKIDAFDTDHAIIRLGVHTGPWRGLGAGPNGLAIESAVDEVCAAAGMDPLAFRIENALDPRLVAVLERVGAVSSWTDRRPNNRPNNRPARRDGKRIGYGVAAGVYKGESYTATVAQVSLDAEGRARVERAWCAHDCGVVVNPDRVIAQCEGNVAWSIGMVLMETLETANGDVLSRSFAESPIPRMADMPDVEVALISSDAPPTGAGETIISSAPAAIANAIRAATGIRPTRFPIDPAIFREA